MFTAREDPVWVGTVPAAPRMPSDLPACDLAVGSDLFELPALAGMATSAQAGFPPALRHAAEPVQEVFRLVGVSDVRLRVGHDVSHPTRRLRFRIVAVSAVLAALPAEQEPLDQCADAHGPYRNEDVDDHPPERAAPVLRPLVHARNSLPNSFQVARNVSQFQMAVWS